MPGFLRQVLAAATLFVLVTRAAPSRAGGPLDPRSVPDALKPWTGWVLDGVDPCPTLYEHADEARCAWPARLDLALGEHGGTFTQSWHLDAAVAVPLPGDAKRWPEGVSVDGRPALVVTAEGQPRISLAAGEHVVRGHFVWDTLPPSLAVPKETGLLSLSLRGVAVAAPNRDAQGMVFFQKTGATEEGDALGIVVHRKVADDIPLRLVTRIELHVSGKSREELLGRALPTSFIPIALDSSLPARLEPDGRVRVQVRPGVFVLELTARSEGPVTSLRRPLPGGPWKDGEEVWVFEAKNDYRVVTIEGVTSIDPQQTTLPETWKRLPAYPMALGAVMRLVETRRGDEAPPPDQLSLVRSLWLDFDGQGYTAQDLLTGALNRQSRLTMAPPTTLGRVAINGHDQFITTDGDASHVSSAALPLPPPRTGVEVREGNLSVTADSRIEGAAGLPNDLPAVGWAHDFHQVSGSLHLPPGWTLLYATGVDEVPGTWVRHWSLLELFLALMVGIVIGRLEGVGWGVIAVTMLVLTLPETDAPTWCWLPLLAFDALTRVLPVGRAQRIFGGARAAAFVLVVIVALLFVVRQVRQGLHPALVQPDLVLASGRETVGTSGGAGTFAKDESVAAAPAQLPSSPATTPLPNNLKGALQLGSASVPRAGHDAGGDLDVDVPKPSQSNAQVYDPAAVVQTGPGLPRWQWTNLELRWSGPVASTQRLHLYLISPAANLGLALLRAALLLLVLYRLFPNRARFLPRFFDPRGSAGAAAAIVFPLLASVASLAPRTARADVPDKAVLDELKTRLLRAPPCSPTCGSAGRLAIELEKNTLRLRLEVDVAARSAIPLPGAGAQWSPENVRVDGHAATALARLDDVLWVSLEAGSHQVLLEGPMPDRGSMQLSLPLKPHRVEVSASGYSVTGVHEDGVADDDLLFTRTEVGTGPDGGALTSVAPRTLPPFVTVTRTLRIGLDWEADTHVDRVSPIGSAFALDVPLLTGERVTSADVRVAAGIVHLFFGPDVRAVAWHSVLAESSPIKLTAPRSVAWTEVWRLDIGPIWHASYSGIPFVHAPPVGGVKTPEWRPWPGEEATVSLTRPEGVAGQTITIDESTVAWKPGLRATDVRLTLSIRSSRGGDHTVTLPEGAQLESLTLNAAPQPIRQDGRKVTVPIAPGAQQVELAFRSPAALSTLFVSPPVDLGAPSVNATVTLENPGDRWLLFTAGPRVGPATLFWSLLLVLVLVAIALGRNRWTPLRTRHWALLFIGLSQVDIVAGAFFVGWLLALGYRARAEGDGPSRQWWNLRQVVLVAWTLAALGVLAVSLEQGLLGAPSMQVMGNGSNASELRWFTDRTGSALPTVRIVSVPLLVYRAAMLAWALWLVLSLLSWLRWGFRSFTHGGAWKKRLPPLPRPA